MAFWAHALNVAFGRPGSDLLSRVLRRSTIGAGAFHGRVRNGIGCSHPAVTTRSAKRNVHEKLVFFVCFDLIFYIAHARAPFDKLRAVL